MGGAGTTVTWSDIRPLAVTLDAQAATLAIPGWSKLTEDTNYPYTQTGIVSASLAQRFEVSVNTGTNQAIITDRYLITGIGGGAYSLPNATLENLANNGDLYFVTEEDSCWCKHSFKVTPAGGGKWTLETADDVACLGACQKIEVPEVGSDLSYTQKFIPAGYTTGWLRGQATGLTGSNPRRTGKKCKYDSGFGCGYEFEHTGTPSPAYEYTQGGTYNLAKAERALTGYFTWPIRKAYMDILVSKVNQIITGSCGTQADTVYKRDEDEKYLAGCYPSFADLQWTLFKNGGGSTSPGCMTVPDELPWNAPTCSGETCDSGAPKVYWATVTQLTQIINELGAQLQVHSAECPDECLEVCPAPILSCRSRSASKSKCGYQKDGDPNFYLKRTHCVDGKRRVDTQTVDMYGNCTESQSAPSNDINCCPGFINPNDGKAYSVQYQPSSGSVSTETCSGTCSGSVTSTWSADCTYETVYESTSSMTCTGGEGGMDYSCTGRTASDGAVYVTVTINGETQPETLGSCVDCLMQDPQFSGLLVPPNEFEDPYSTATLIDKVHAAFDDWTGTSCSSARNLPDGEGSYAERQGKYKVSIAAALPDGMPAGKRLQVQVWTVFTPLEGSPSSTSELKTINSGETETAEFDIAVPSANGTNEVMLGEYYCEAI